MGDYASAGDNQIPETESNLDWEIPATINGTWGFKTNDDNWKSSEPGPIQGELWCRTTRKEGTVYLYVFDWPEGGKINLNGMSASSARLLASNQELQISLTENGVVTQGPATAPDASATVIVFDKLTKEK